MINLIQVGEVFLVNLSAVAEISRDLVVAAGGSEVEMTRLKLVDGREHVITMKLSDFCKQYANHLAFIKPTLLDNESPVEPEIVVRPKKAKK